MNIDEVERIQFPDGNWWEIYTVVTRRMRKKFRLAARAGFAAGINGDNNIDLNDTEAMRQYVMALLKRLNPDYIDDAYLLEGTHAWSFGMDITTENIDSLPDRVTSKVLGRMRSLYAEVTEQEQGDLAWQSLPDEVAKAQEMALKYA